MIRKFLPLALACVTLLAACGQISEKQRERDEIINSLKQYIDKQPGFEQDTADRSVRIFNVDRERAEVVVEFKSRKDASIRLMIYHLRREGTAWTVKDAKPYTPRPV